MLQNWARLSCVCACDPLVHCVDTTTGVAGLSAALQLASAASVVCGAARAASLVSRTCFVSFLRRPVPIVQHCNRLAALELNSVRQLRRRHSSQLLSQGESFSPSQLHNRPNNIAT
jgi:hypothetical protein